MRTSKDYPSRSDVNQVGVGYFLYTEVFAHDSKTRLFNRVVDRIRADPRALELLGTGQKIGAFGEPTANKWSRNRPLAYEKEEIAFGILKTYTANSSGTFTDRSGITHFKMHFNVSEQYDRNANEGLTRQLGHRLSSIRSCLRTHGDRTRHRLGICTSRPNPYLLLFELRFDSHSPR